MKSKLLTVLPAVVAFLLISTPAYAQDGSSANLGIGIGLAVGLACAGAGIGQGNTGAAAMSGIARNPQASGKIFTPMIIALALMEALGLYGFVVALILNGKL